MTDTENTGTWTAEDIPAYQFDGKGRRPMTDEDAAMSAPIVLVKEASEKEARTALVLHLHLAKNRSYAERYHEEGAYDEAIRAVMDGAQLVRIRGRGYRIRDTAACEGQHFARQNCPNCLPDTYPHFTREA